MTSSLKSYILTFTFIGTLPNNVTLERFVTKILLLIRFVAFFGPKNIETPHSYLPNIFSYIRTSTIHYFLIQTKQNFSYFLEHHTHFPTKNGRKVIERIQSEVSTSIHRLHSHFGTINNGSST